MYRNLIQKVSGVAESKNQLLKKSWSRYLLLSMMAGLFVGIGVILIATLGSFLGDSPFKKLILGTSFGIALSLVLIIGSELFTGNNFIMMIGSLEKKVPWVDSIKVWIVSYAGNLLGSMLIAWLFVSAGLSNQGFSDFIVNLSAAKMNGSFVELFFRGILCNILVCLAVFSYIKLKSESAKLIMIFWCLFAFITSGFEHSIANMTIFSLGLLVKHPETVSIAGFMNNLIPVTIGNFVGGGLFLGAGYWFIGNK